MKKLFIAIVMLGSTLMLYAAKADKKVTITVGNESREYWLYVPNNVKAEAPLVLSLHGAGGQCTDKSPFRTNVADKEGCIVAYPQGKMTTFPGLGGMQAYGWSAYGEENFDTDFLKAVVEDVASKYTIDRQRLYCCGFSNGGMMTYVMANTCSNQFAAFAAISGYPINEFHLHHTSDRPVPFLHIHGKADDFVKYSLVPNVIDNMVARNGANPVPEKTTVSGKYTKSIYEAGEDGFQTRNVYQERKESVQSDIQIKGEQKTGSSFGGLTFFPYFCAQIAQETAHILTLEGMSVAFSL